MFPTGTTKGYIYMSAHMHAYTHIVPLNLAHRIWLWVYYNEILIYPVFYVLKRDYTYAHKQPYFQLSRAAKQPRRVRKSSDRLAVLPGDVLYGL